MPYIIFTYFGRPYKAICVVGLYHLCQFAAILIKLKWTIGYNSED